MAAGDLTVFNHFAQYLAEGVIDLDGHTFKLGLITDVATPVVTQTDPLWGTYSTNEVSPQVGDYSAGGLTIATPDVTRSVAVTKWDDDGSNLSIAQNGSGFTNARWGILYDDTQTTPVKPAVAFLDLGGDVSQVAGPITITWNTSGILTITRT